MKKEDLIAKAEELKITLDGSETVEKLKELIDNAEAAGEPSAAELRMRKNNRGTKRRLRKSLDTFQTALDEFARDLDALTFLADQDGNKVGSSPMVDGVRAFRHELTEEVGKILE